MSGNNRYQVLVYREAVFGDEVVWSLKPGVYWTTARASIEIMHKGCGVTVSREPDDGSPPMTLKTKFGLGARLVASLTAIGIRWLLRRPLRW